MNAVLRQEISRLTQAEKLQLVEELWNDITTSTDPLPIPDWHRQELAEDRLHYEANPAEGSPWSEVKARITQRS